MTRNRLQVYTDPMLSESTIWTLPMFMAMAIKFDPNHPPQFGDGDIRANNQAYTKERLLEIRRKLQPIKERFGHEVQDLIRVAIQYALAQSPNTCVIPWFKNASQVESNAAAAGQPLTAEEVSLVKSVFRG